MPHGTPQPKARVLFLCVIALAPMRGARAQGANEPAASQPPQAAPAEDVKRVTYVPEVVKQEIRQQVKEEVLQEMQKNQWAAPRVYPEWLRRISFHGDLRIRYEIDNFGHGNAVDYYPDFNAINQSSKGFDVNFRDPTSERWLNTAQRRARARLRARFDVDVDLGQGFFTELRIASGDGPTPVSTNQTIAGGNGSFSKYQIWLDRANLRYYPLRGAASQLAFFIGRFENPFFRTDLTWDENINMDGVATQVRVRAGSLRPFMVGGAFPIFNTLFDLPPEQPAKFVSRDKWLYAGQLGTDWTLSSRLIAKFGAAFFFFDRVRGILGSDCDTNLASVSCDTDHSRPLFAQKGNTYRPLRTPSIAALDAELNSGASQYQYFGLASGFRNLVYTARFDFLALQSLRLILDGEFVHNVAFHKDSVGPLAVNNFKPCAATDNACRENPQYGGGNYGYLTRLTVGSPGAPAILRRWDWSASISYRYLQSDAIIDAFANSEFALGGTNNKGFVATASLGLSENIWFTARWLSSDVVVGPQYSIDVVHFDLNARY